MNRAYRICLFLLVVSLLAGCAGFGFGPPAPGGGKVFQSQKPRAAAPQVEQADRQALSAGNAAFALDLYHVVNSDDENRFFSPYSISLALAMTYAGARGETERQMGEVLHYTLPQDRLHPAFNALDQELASRKKGQGQGADGKGFRLNIVNDMWGQKDYTFLPDYLDLLSVNYGAGLRLMDFQSDPEAARKAINQYITEKTEKRIKDLIPPGALTQYVRLVLTNAIYFNAAWQYPFGKDQTKPAPFTRLDGSQEQAPMMSMPSYESLAYGKGTGYQAVALPYENHQISMLVLVPDAGTFADFEAGLNADRLEKILAEMQGASVLVRMPKFTVEDSFALSKALAKLGMPAAFDPQLADFSGIDGERSLFISEVLHKSFVKVDEAGTEAAAATAVIISTTSAPASTVELTIDRPFLFLIRDEITGAILFIGRVTNPAK